MIPQLAHHHRTPTQQFDDGFAAPPLDQSQNSRVSSGHLPFRNVRSLSSSSILPLQRPYPVKNHGSPREEFRGGSSTPGFGRQYHDPSEHMLRRKTPNGTLAAGYDGTPVQWASKAPALKHVLLPSSAGSGQQTASSFSSEAHHVQHRSNSVSWNYQSSPFALNDHSGRMNNDHGGWFHVPSPNSRNIWDQIPMQQQATTYHPNNGIQIPTAIQPQYQYPPGPTASNNDGGMSRIGPYWPDGEFIAYRPAAIRHAGLQQNFQFGANNGMQQANASANFAEPFRQSSFNADALYQNGRLPFMSNDSGARFAENHYSSPQRWGADTPYMYSAIPDGNRTPTAQSPHPVNNYHFKEKTLSWAHSIYVDLLAFLQQSKKEDRQTRQASRARGHPKNSIYPKPPRQPLSAWGNSEWIGSHKSGRDDSISPRNRQGSTASISNRTGSSGNYGAWQGNGELGETKFTRFSSQDTPHYVSPFQPPQPSASSPLSKSKEALEMLSTLCEQSGWSWIDGMLLGGCLAYGLEDYHKALEWYSKIISTDSKHVEAISNLAATLLCLNRREEAEQHWLQSVKLRPSYFEAVEHLIGLLCVDHRGKEAVDIIEFVERSIRLPKVEDHQDLLSETSSNADRSSFSSMSTTSDKIINDFESDTQYHLPVTRDSEESSLQPGFGSSGFSIPGSENGRILALVHAKGNMLYALGDIDGASRAFEDAVLISAGRTVSGIHGLIGKIINVLSIDGFTPLRTDFSSPAPVPTSAPLLLPPDRALQTARLVFTKNGDLPGLRYVPEGVSRKAAISTTSNSLLSLAKIFQDAMSNNSSPHRISRMPGGVGDILALYYLSLSLQPSPSTANNVGILLASVQQPVPHRPFPPLDDPSRPSIPGVVPGSGVALALAYYNYGLLMDSRHAHLYTNLGSLLKDIGQLSAAIKMYEQAVSCDGTFDIALANLANAVKDQGRTSDAIEYYRRAVASSPDFAEAVCGLANALNSVCDWAGRGGVILDRGKQDRWHVDDNGMIIEATTNGSGSGWMKRVVDIVTRQLRDGASWGRGTLRDQTFHLLLRQLEAADGGSRWTPEKRNKIQDALASWAGNPWEGARVLRLIERATKRAMHRWYHDKHVKKKQLPPSSYTRPQLPSSLSVPAAPTVLPFHTFTCPLSAKDIRMISQRNALRISCSTLRAPWMQGSVFPPPSPPMPQLNIGYVSSDFNNHPLAHLMQSVFGMHDIRRAKAFCYATTPSDNSIHRQQIEREAPVFRDVNSWTADKLVQQIIADEIHVLVNLNGYTRGARNEVFAARPAPIQMSFMGFAGTLGAEWCDYLLADETAIPRDTLRPSRLNVDIEDQLLDQDTSEEEDWVYSENIIFCKDTFFCCDHAQSESREHALSWEAEQSTRWAMRKELFPTLSDDAIILGNFNQLYKIEPSTFRTWLRILDKVPKAILWLLRFPDLGESNLKKTALAWAGESVASRIWFTDVAPKHQHISRARVCDLFLDTPECNAHTTAADVLWSSTPLLALPRYKYKMCSRMAASILKGALPRGEVGRRAAEELIAKDDDQYEEFAIRLANGLSYNIDSSGRGQSLGRLGELRKILFDSRWTCALFDTKRWVSDLESAYEEAWRRWVSNEGGDIYL